MKHMVFRLACISLLAGAGSANAAIVYYTESATVSGTLNGVSFTNSLITLQMVSDTTDVTTLGGFPEDTVGTISIDIASLGVIANLTGTSLVYDTSGAAGLADADLTETILATFDPAFDTYDLTTAVGPITNSTYFNSSYVLPTDQGSFTISAAGNSTFTASFGSAVPEPKTITLLGLGLAAAIAFKRRVN